jgi:hypothetical protein
LYQVFSSIGLLPPFSLISAVRTSITIPVTVRSRPYSSRKCSVPSVQAHDERVILSASHDELPVADLSF